MENNFTATLDYDEDSDEAALVSRGDECYNCSEKGHKVVQCKKPKKEEW